MQRAKIEANDAFKNVQLGQMTSNTKKRKIQNTDDNEIPKKLRQNALTRTQKAKIEAEKAFENVSLDKISQKKSKLEREKLERKLIEGKKNVKTSEFRKAGSFKSSSQVIKPVLNHSNTKVSKGYSNQDVRSVSTNTPKSLTRSQSAKLEVLKSFEGKGLDDLSSNNSSKANVTKDSTKQPLGHDIKATHSDEVAIETSHDNMAPQDQEHTISPVLDNSAGCKRLTRLERAKLEALKSFSGQQFGDICKHSTRIVAKYLKPKKDKACNTEEPEACHTPTHTNESHEQEKPKLEENIKGQRSLLKTIHTGTFTTVPSHEYLSHKKPRVDVYSSIIEGNFKDHSSLLETSRRVVETAIQLETPEGSPAQFC
jgi:hypothetical protein